MNKGNQPKKGQHNRVQHAVYCTSRVLSQWTPGAPKILHKLNTEKLRNSFYILEMSQYTDIVNNLDIKKEDRYCVN